MSVLWLNNLTKGINQNSISMLENENFELLVNASQVQTGSLCHRLGANLVHDSITAANGVQGGGTFFKDTGVSYKFMVADGDIHVTTTGNWTVLESSVYNATDKVEMVTYDNKLYIAGQTSAGVPLDVRSISNTGTSTKLKLFSTTAASTSTGTTLKVSDSSFSEGMIGMTVYNVTDATSVTITAFTDENTVTVSSSIGDTWDNDTIEMYFKAKYIATNGANLVLAGNDVYPNRVYYTDLEVETFDPVTNFVILPSPPTGVASFGNGRDFIAFTQNGYLVFEAQNPRTNYFEGFGCISHRTIKNIKGMLVWLGKNGVFLLASNTSYPTDISTPLKNDLKGDSIFNNIDFSSNLTAAGVKDTRYYLSVGDLQAVVRGVTLDNCVLIYNLQLNSWSVDTYTRGELAAAFIEYSDDGTEKLYAGSFTSGTFYELETIGQYGDDNSSGVSADIDLTFITKHFTFTQKGDGAVLQKNIKNVHFWYYAANTTSLSYSLNGASSYTSFATLPAYTTNRWDWAYTNAGTECKSFSLKGVVSGRFELYALGLELDVKSSTGIIGFA